MNAIPRLCAAALLLAVAPSAGARTSSQAPPAEAPQAAPPQQKQDAGRFGQEVDQLREYSAERRDEAVANARRAAEDLDRQMERLQEQMDKGWDRMSQATRTRSQATMADLRKRRNALAEWYGGMRHSSASAWIEVKAGFVKSYHELADALRTARTEFAQDEKERAADKPGRDEPAPGEPAR